MKFSTSLTNCQFQLALSQIFDKIYYLSKSLSTWWEAEKAKKATLKAIVIHVVLLMALIAILIIRYSII